MTFSEAQIFGLSVKTQETVEEQRVWLTKAGLNPAALLGGLKSLHDAAVAANEAQEAAKRSARQSTETFVALKDELYEMASGVLDMVIAAVGKNSDAAKNIRRYRSDVRRRQSNGTVPPGPTTTAP